MTYRTLFTIAIALVNLSLLLGLWLPISNEAYAQKQSSAIRQSPRPLAQNTTFIAELNKKKHEEKDKGSGANANSDQAGWSKPVNGLQWRLECDKTIYTLGEVPTVTMYLRNAGKKTITLFGWAPSLVNVYSWFPLPMSYKSRFELGEPILEREQFHILHPRETCQLHSIKLKPEKNIQWYPDRNSPAEPFSRSDIYRLEVWFRNDEHDNRNGSTVHKLDGKTFGFSDVWTGTIEAHATFAVLPKTPGATIDDLQCQIWTDKKEYQIGDRIIVNFSIKNLGKHRRRLFLQWLAPSICAFVVQGPDGNLIPFSGAIDNVRSLSENNFKTIESGGSFQDKIAWFNTVEHEEVPPAYRIVMPGTYKITMLLNIGSKGYNKQQGFIPVQDAWTGILPSNTIEIIRRTNEEKMK